VGGKSKLTENRAEIVLQILKQNLALPSWTKSKRDPFETLIVTIISQNTSDTNTDRAFETLFNRLKISPKVLANAELSEIEGAIKTAGLYKGKARTIKETSSLILKKYNGSLQPILSLPLGEARKTLMAFPGVGPKTADVVLLFSAKHPTIPVDTHVNRAAKRLGFAPDNADYEQVRGNLQSLFDPTDYLAVHLLFIAHGRKTCKAIRALCCQCPLNEYCPSNGKWSKP
jgi:endonuclease-3